MSNLQLYQEKGLTEAESKLVDAWVTSGKPGIGRVKADFLSSIYNLGYTAQDIHKMFPEYGDLAAILFARFTFEWDRRRDEYSAHLRATIAPQAIDARLESVRFLTEVVRASHVKWREQIMRYLAAPDREKAPGFLADDIKEYKEIMLLLKELTTPDKIPGQKGDENPNAQGLPSIHIHANNGVVTVTNERVGDVKAELLKDVTDSAKKKNP